MRKLPELFENNRQWAARVTSRDPSFFSRLANQQSPKFLWIGCSDSRVPANVIVGLLPGELFVHRNVANVVVQTDLNCLSVLQYAIEVLRIEHVIVCGHYGCGGVRAAFLDSPLGLIDNWLRAVRDVRDRHREALDRIADPDAAIARLCELNVIEQARQVCRTTIVAGAWARHQPLAVHGWIYDVADGLLHDLGCTVAGPREADEVFERVLAATPR